jgi:hypothetical protein
MKYTISAKIKQGKEDAHADSVREAKERNKAIRRYEKRRHQVHLRQEEAKEASHSSSTGDSPPNAIDENIFTC